MKIFFVIISFLLLAGVLIFKQYSSPQVQTLADLESATGLSFSRGKEYVVQKDLLRKGDGGAYRSIEASQGGRLLKIQVTTGLSEKQASRIVEERLTMVRSLYSNLPSPYPGMVTKKITVTDKLQPGIRQVEVAGAALPLYILASNARYTYGAMTEETVAYQGGLCFFYNSSTGTLYRFDYFIPREEFNEDELVVFFTGIQSSGGSLSFPGESGSQSGPKMPADSPAVSKPRSPVDDTLQFKGYNLILVALEPLGANHVSGYGYGKNTTPNLDAFAANGFLFANAVSGSSWSLPAFMSWFTSLYPSQHKVINKYSTFSTEKKVLANLSALSPDVVTLAQVFQQNGYHTAGFTGDASLSRGFGFDLGFDIYYDEQRFGGFDRTMPRSIDWLAEHKSEKLFLFVQGYDVHGQFPLERQYLQEFLGADYEGPYKGSVEEYWELRNQNIEQGQIAVTEEDMRLWRAVYDAKIFAADQRLGAFLRKLEEFDLLEKSIIIFSSGSGNEYNEHGRIDHGFSLYEELIHVPLVIRVPGRSGQIPDLVRTIDIMPTVLDLLDLQATPQVREQMQGASLVPLMAGGKLDFPAVSETDYLSLVFKRSIKKNDGWKLIVSLDTEERELYYLKDDPAEQKNLIESQGRIAYELEQLMFSHLRKGPGPR